MPLSEYLIKNDKELKFTSILQRKLLKKKSKSPLANRKAFEKACNELLLHYKETGITPKRNDFWNYSDAARRKYWVQFSKDIPIDSWSNLLRHLGLGSGKNKGKKQAKNELIDAKKKVLAYYHKHKRAPPSMAKEFSDINSNAKKSGFWLWKPWGITSWNTFLDYCGIPKNHEIGIWKGELEDLNIAKKYVLDFYDNHGRVPVQSDLNFIAIQANKKIWVKFNINTWNELLIECGMTPTVQMNIWTGKKGFIKARDLILEFFHEFYKTPKQDENKQFRSISGFASHYYWQEWGIRNWNDLIRYCGLDVNHDMGKWKGEIGLKRAKSELLAYREYFGTTPTQKKMGSIAASARTNWKQFNITSWNELLGYCGLDPNHDVNKWTGEKGLKKAKELILEYYQNHNRSPTQADFNVITQASRTNWKQFDIKGWNELLTYCGLEINHKLNIWAGEEGLITAQKKIKEFVKDNKCIPVYDNLQELAAAAERGHWIEFNVLSWTDLIRSCGYQPRIGRFGILWKKWEKWCEEVISIVYKNNGKIQPETRLPNQKMPDFNFNLHGQFVIGDAKINSIVKTIKKDIQNYLPYCDKLEFWCLFGHRSAEKYNGKDVYFLTSTEILNRIKSIDQRRQMKAWLDDLNNYKEQDIAIQKIAEQTGLNDFLQI